MTYRGRVQDGVVVLEGVRRPREGAVVRVEEEAVSKRGAKTAARNGKHLLKKEKPAKRNGVGGKVGYKRADLAEFAEKNPPPASWFNEPACDLTKPQ